MFTVLLVKNFSNIPEAVIWANGLPGTDVSVEDYPRGIVDSLKSVSISEVYATTAQAQIVCSVVVNVKEFDPMELVGA